MIDPTIQCTHDLITDINLSIQNKCMMSNYCEYSYINLIKFNYCYFEDRTYITYGLAILLLLFCFYFLSNTSNNYLAPALVKISEKLKLSQSLAGLTLFAFGNQAPDLFVALIVGDNDEDGAETALCSLIGSQMIITCMILPCVVLLGNGVKVNGIYFIRDFFVFILSLTLINVMGIFKEIYIWESICFFLLYFVYVIICFIMDKKKEDDIEKSIEKIEKMDIEKTLDQSDPTQTTFDNDNDQNNNDNDQNNNDDDDHGDLHDTLYTISGNPLENVELLNQSSLSFKTKKRVEMAKKKKAKAKAKQQKEKKAIVIIKKILFYIFKYPLDFVRDITIPPFEEDKWNRWFFLIMPITLPSFLFYITHMIPYAIQHWPYTIAFYVVMIGLMMIIVWKAFKVTLPPCEGLLVLIAFIMSILWLWFMTNLLMDAIITIQMLIPFNIPQGFFNMTVIAFGNCLPDFLMSCALATTGYAEMAFSGSIGAPVFGMFFSYGLSLIKGNFKKKAINFPIFNFGKLSNRMIIIGMISLGINGIQLLIQGIITKFHIKKWLSLIGISVYLMFIAGICYFTFVY